MKKRNFFFKAMLAAVAALFVSTFPISDTVRAEDDSSARLSTLVKGNGEPGKSKASASETQSEDAASAKLYFPRVATTDGWETEIAVVNPSDKKLDGALKMYDNAGRQTASTPCSLNPYGRVEIAAGKELPDPDKIGYAVFAADRPGAVGYMKFFREGKARGAVPAISEINEKNIHIAHVASGNGWSTGISLVNTGSSTAKIEIVTSNGDSFDREIGSGHQYGFLIRDLYDGKPQPGISSATIKNAAGIVGVSIFSKENLLSAVSLNDNTNREIFYSHIASKNQWGTGVAAFNPSDKACEIEIKPYAEDGSALKTQKDSIPAKSRFVKLTSTMNLPEETAWLSIQASNEITGFELFTRQNQMAGYTGTNIERTSGVFPKIDKEGATGVAFVNISNKPTTATLYAHENSGKEIASETVNLKPFEKVVKKPEQLFKKDISKADYIRFSSDSRIVGFQLNSSLDGMMLDALPAM